MLIHSISPHSEAEIKQKHGHGIKRHSKSPDVFYNGESTKKSGMCRVLFENNNVLNKNVNKSASVCFGGFFNAQKLANNNLFKKSLEFAADNGALFAATFALFTAMVLRPATILATPGVKKENKEYACAKSFASSLMGFGIMAVVSTPIAAAIKKINKNPEKFLKPDTIKTLSSGTENLIKSSRYKLATQVFKLGADFTCAIPKAMLTCALIPPIMCMVFPKRKTTDIQKSLPVYFKSNTFKGCNSDIYKPFIKENIK